jgi:hypothetical protein
MKVVGFGCGPWRWYKGVGEIHMNKGRVGEERRGKETDGCSLTGPYPKPMTFIPKGPTTSQRSTHQMLSTFGLLPHSYLRSTR